MCLNVRDDDHGDQIVNFPVSRILRDFAVNNPIAKSRKKISFTYSVLILRLTRGVTSVRLPQGGTRMQEDICDSL